MGCKTPLRSASPSLVLCFSESARNEPQKTEKSASCSGGNDSGTFSSKFVFVVVFWSPQLLLVVQHSIELCCFRYQATACIYPTTDVVRICPAGSRRKPYKERLRDKTEKYKLPSCPIFLDCKFPFYLNDLMPLQSVFQFARFLLLKKCIRSTGFETSGIKLRLYQSCEKIQIDLNQALVVLNLVAIHGLKCPNVCFVLILKNTTIDNRLDVALAHWG